MIFKSKSPIPACKPQCGAAEISSDLPMPFSLSDLVVIFFETLEHVERVFAPDMLSLTATTRILLFG